jgi:hypothetical protein
MWRSDGGHRDHLDELARDLDGLLDALAAAIRKSRS